MADEPQEVHVLIESNGFGGNVKYAFFSNAKSYAHFFLFDQAVMSSAGGFERNSDGSGVRYMAIRSAIRIAYNVNSPVVLLGRTCHRRFPGFQVISTT